jgi:hypothetical protein
VLVTGINDYNKAAAPVAPTGYNLQSLPAAVSAIPTGAVKRATISTPTLVAHWPAQKISAACSLVATGSAYSTVTSTGAMQVVTTTTTVDSTIYSVSTTTTSATASAPKSCPTQVVINDGSEDGTATPFVFSEGPNFFDNSGGRLDLLDDATLAHSGSYLARVVETDASLGGLNFRLSQTVPVCPDASYTFNFYASSQFNPAGSTQCNLKACVGDVCTSFDPAVGDRPNQLVSLLFPGSDAASVVVSIYTAKIFLGTGIVFCGRRFVRFDDFSQTSMV